jgi:hypothetical protein
MRVPRNSEPRAGSGPGRVSRTVVACSAALALVLAAAWAVLTAEYATGDASLRAASEGERVQLLQTLVGAAGVLAAAAAGATGLAHARTGERRWRRWHLAGLAGVLVALPPWAVFAFTLSSN